MELGSSLDTIEINVRGTIVKLNNSNNSIFIHSARLKEYIKNKNYPLFLDIDPNSFHVLLNYFKFMIDFSKNSSQLMEVIRNLFLDEMTNNPNIIYTMVYLEIDSSFIQRFIK